jgi:hypothetical protein
MKARNWDWPIKKELAFLPGHLDDGETVLDLLSGSANGHGGLAALTNRRLIFIEAEMLGPGEAFFEAVDRSEFSTATVKKNWSGCTMTLGRKTATAWVMDNVVEQDAQRLLSHLGL